MDGWVCGLCHNFRGSVLIDKGLGVFLLSFYTPFLSLVSAVI